MSTAASLSQSALLARTPISASYMCLSRGSTYVRACSPFIARCALQNSRFSDEAKLNYTTWQEAAKRIVPPLTASSHKGQVRVSARRLHNMLDTRPISLSVTFASPLLAVPNFTEDELDDKKNNGFIIKISLFKQYSALNVECYPTVGSAFPRAHLGGGCPACGAAGGSAFPRAHLGGGCPACIHPPPCSRPPKTDPRSCLHPKPQPWAAGGQAGRGGRLRRVHGRAILRGAVSAARWRRPGPRFLLSGRWCERLKPKP